MKMGEGGNSDLLIAINDVIDKTIDKFFPTHPIYHIMPYFWKGELKIDSDFFHDNQTPLSETLTYSSSDLKTISHLSLYHKNRIAYDPKSVDRMLQSTGLIKWNETVFSMGIYRVGHCGDSRYSISKEDYYKLPENAQKVIMINTDIKITRTYFDGIDIGYDKIGVK
jgi:hypothetical protein